MLRKPTNTIVDFGESLRQLAFDMLETMHAANGVGLAAPQISQSLRLLVADVSKARDCPLILINPEITDIAKASREREEGCLSIPGVNAIVKRPDSLSITAYDVEGKQQYIEADGLLATCLQHEMDHLNGILFIDHLSRLKKGRIIRKYFKIHNITEECADI